MSPHSIGLSKICNVHACYILWPTSDSCIDRGFALAESWCLVNRQTGALAFKDICYTISVFRQIWLTVYGSGNAIMVQLFKRFKALPAMASDRQLMLIAKVDIAQKVKVRSNVGLPRKYIVSCSNIPPWMCSVMFNQFWGLVQLIWGHCGNQNKI